MKTPWICPKCSEALSREGTVLKCSNGHCYDMAKQGYVNLLMSQKSSAKRHGDDKLMVQARSAFLDRGYYDCIKDCVVDAAIRYSEGTMTVVDAGCGEGYYTAAVANSLESHHFTATFCGVDLSKDALAAAMRRLPSLHAAVGGIFQMPLKDNSCNMVLHLFAPLAAEEFYRVLKTGGVLLRVIPLERHLWELKCAIYDSPYENKVESLRIPGFQLKENIPVETTISIPNQEHIDTLFKMTPYYYKTGKRDQEKAAALTHLSTTVSCSVLVYRKTSL